MEKLKINIKTPCQESDDRELEACSDWSVKKIKIEIEKCWSNHPRPEDQRLVYAGKLLQDEWVLSDILRQDEELNCHTMHLICRQTSFSPISKRNTATSELRQRKNGNDSQSASATELYQNIVSSITPGASNSNTTSASSINVGSNNITAPNFAYDQTNPWQMYLNSQSAVANQNTQYMSQNPEQLLAMHQMYLDRVNYDLNSALLLQSLESFYNINRSNALENTLRINHTIDNGIQHARFGNQDINQINDAGQHRILPEIDAPFVADTNRRNVEEIHDNRLLRNVHRVIRRNLLRNRIRNVFNWFNSISKAIFLVLILFFYSTTAGVIRVLLCGTLFYLLKIVMQMANEREITTYPDNDNTNIINQENRRSATSEQALNRPQNVNENTAGDLDLRPNYDNEQLFVASAQGIHEPVHLPALSWNQALCNFITSFFASLVPDDPAFI